jgi:gamma-glutamyl phosphate reductase
MSASDLHVVVGSSVRVSFGGEFGVSAAKAAGTERLAKRGLYSLVLGVWSRTIAA